MRAATLEQASKRHSKRPGAPSVPMHGPRRPGAPGAHHGPAIAAPAALEPPL